MGRKFTIFALFCFVFEGKFQVQAPRVAYIQRGDLTEGFCITILGGLYLEGLIFEFLRYFIKKAMQVLCNGQNFSEIIIKVSY